MTRRSDPIWTATVPGHTGHAMAVDASTRSIYVGDGWGVAYRALAVRRLDLDSGDELASAPTRSRASQALLPLGATLWVSTDRRLLALDPSTLQASDAIDYSGVSHAQRLGADDERLVAASWLGKHVAVIDRATGEVVKRRVAGQPSVASTSAGVRVYSAFEGGYRTFALDHSVQRHADGPAVTAVSSDRSIWGVLASGQMDDQGLYHHPSASIARLDQPGPLWDAARPISRIVVDDDRSALWLIDQDDCLVRMDQVSGRVDELPLPGRVRLVDAAAGVIVTGEPLDGSSLQLRAFDLADVTEGWAEAR